MSAMQQLCVAVVAICCLQLVTAREPPRISSRVDRRQIGRVGEQVRLPCPVEANPAPLLQWTKDDESIHAGWDRFKMLSHGLRIKNVMHEDEGVYTCKATNGFGTISVDFILYVLDVNETVTPPTEYDERLLGQDDDAVAPEFVNTEMMGEPHVMQPAGSTVRLRCRATGKPRPNVVWLRAGQVIEQPDDSDSKWLLRLANAQEDDSGKYTCKVFNSAGTINFTYTLEIVEKLKAKPELVAPHPENTTVAYGGLASFLCRVRSPVQPHIQWLKKVDSLDDIRNKNTTITVEEQQFIVLKTGKVLSRTDGTYLNRLTINNAKPEDSGVYICLGANSMGYNIRSAYLTVLPRPVPPQEHVNDSGLLDAPLLGIIIGLAGVVVIIIVVVIVVTIYRRQQVRQRNKAMTRPARPLPYAQPEKQYYDHQYAVLQQQHAQGLHQAPPPPMGGPQYSHNPMQGMPGRDRYMGSPYPDLHSESSISKSATPVSMQQPQQHTHIHYGGC